MQSDYSRRNRRLREDLCSLRNPRHGVPRGPRRWPGCPAPGCVRPASASRSPSSWSATVATATSPPRACTPPPASNSSPVSLATVYNTLRAFCEAGLVHEVTVDGTRSYFDTRTDDHPHYYWEDDGSLTDAPNGAIRLAGPPLIPEGAELDRIDVVIRLRRRPA